MTPALCFTAKQVREIKDTTQNAYKMEKPATRHKLITLTKRVIMSSSSTPEAAREGGGEGGREDERLLSEAS